MCIIKTNKIVCIFIMLKELSVYLKSVMTYLDSRVDFYHAINLPSNVNMIRVGGVEVSIHEYIGWVE